MMVRTDGVEILEPLGVGYITEFRYVCRAALCGLEAKQVSHANVVDCRHKQFWMLHDGATHGNSACTCTHHGKMLRRRVAFLDEILSHRDHVVDGVLLCGHSSGVVPILAELTSTSDVRMRVDPATFKPSQHLGIEGRISGNAVGTISLVNRGVRTIKQDVFLAE